MESFYFGLGAAIAALVAAVIKEFGPELSTQCRTRRRKPTKYGWFFICCIMIVCISAMVAAVSAYNRAMEEARSTKRIIRKIEKESQRLTPNDFVVRVLVAYRLPPPNIPIVFPISGEITKYGNSKYAFFRAELSDVSEYRIRGGGRGPGYYGRRFYAKNISFGGLETFPYISDLDGFTLELSIGSNLFPKADSDRYPTPQVSVDLFVRGRHFIGMVEQNKVTIPMSFEHIKEESN